jgi:integrase
MTEARKSLTAWLERRRGSLSDFVFPSRTDYMGLISTRQYARLLDEWVSTVGLDKQEYGTHSLRRTKAALIYKATGNLRAIQILLGHTNIEHTVRYLGVDVDDAFRGRFGPTVWAMGNEPELPTNEPPLAPELRFAAMSCR